MKAPSMRAWVTVWLCIGLLAGAGGAHAITLTGSVDLDFVGQPGVIVVESADLTPPYAIDSPPLSKYFTNGDPLLQENAVVPSGFHVSRTALYYDCETDTLYVGYDVSNETTYAGVGTGIVGRAWDMDGDGDPCGIANLYLEPAAVPVLTDLVPPGGLTEKYQLTLYLDGDPNPDMILSVYDNGFPTSSDTCAIGFAGPCNHNIWATLKNPLGECLTQSPYNLGIDVVYGTDETHRDIEFSIQGYAAYVLGQGLDPCNPAIKVFADSDFDFSPETDLDLGTVPLICPCEAMVDCDKTVRIAGTTEELKVLELCYLPQTVVYRLAGFIGDYFMYRKSA